MKFSWFVIFAMVLLAFGGCLINQKLTLMHVDESSATGKFADICAPEGSPAFDCKAVIKTKWAMWPPNEPDPETGQQTGLPVALLGWWYFTAIALWSVLIGRCDHSRRGWHYLLLLGVFVGCAVSAFYLYILFFGEMEAKCLWCMISHGINFLLLIGALLLIPRRPRAATETVATETVVAESAGGAVATSVQQAKATPIMFGHPTPRLLLATCVCVIAAILWESAVTGRAVALREAKMQKLAVKQQQQMLEEFYKDTEALAMRFEKQESVEFEHPPDAPKRGEGNMLLPLVVFSDFQCPACREFARQLEEEIVPAFGGMLRVYWKHLPWSTDCNPITKRNMHPQACTAAFAGEAARMLGGNDAFWKAHDLIFAAQGKLAKMDYRALAKELELDPDKFVEAMESDEAKERVAEDIELAKSLGVKVTPQVYLWGRQVDRRMLKNKGFIDRINDVFIKRRSLMLGHTGRTTPRRSNQPAAVDDGQ